MSKQPQYFERVGQDRYVVIDQPRKNKPLYAWDEVKKRIIPADLIEGHFSPRYEVEKIKG